MKDQLTGLLGRAWAQFKAFSPGQKAVTIAAGLALIIGGYVFLTWKSTPTYAPLYTNLAASDASAIVDKLNSAGISYQLGQAGTEILVPQDKVYATRLAISAAGLPASTQTGYSLLDKEGVTTSQFQQQVDYQRAIEGELDKTIEAMTGVQTASVHLAIPQQSVFNDGSQKTTAAVLLALTGGTQLTTTQVQSIVYLVSSSVPNLSANDVTVTDSTGALLAAPGDNITTAAGVDTQSQATQTYDTELEQKIQTLLTALVGPGHAVVTVDAHLDFNKTTTTKRAYVYDPKAPPLSEQRTTENYTGSGANAAGTLGASQTGSTVPSTSPGKYKKTQTTRDNALGTMVNRTETAPGSPMQQSVAVLVDSAVKGVSLNKVKALINSAAGIQTSRGDTVSVQAMPFDTTAAKAAAAAALMAQKTAAQQASQQRMASLIKQGAFGAIVLGVLIGTWLASRRRRKRARQRTEPEDVMPEIFEPAPDPVPEAPVVAPVVDPEAEEAAARRQALATLAAQQPREVASVLSSWLGGKGDLANDHARSPW